MGKWSDWGALLGSAVSLANDKIPILDVSAAAADQNKTILAAELAKALVETGDWTPTLTCATPNDLNVVFATQTGKYIKFGNLYLAMFELDTSTFTHTTASGSVRINGAPGTPTLTWIGFVHYWRGVTKANFTDMGCQINTSGNITFIMSGSAQNHANLAITDCPTGGDFQIRGAVIYLSS